MKEGQKKIYYLAGESKDSVANSPLLEALVSKGYEVLYLTDSIDEYWTQSYQTYDGHQLVNISKDVNLDIEEDAEKPEDGEEVETFTELTTFFKNTLGSKISKCVLSKRLVSTPSALVSAAYGFSANMERIQKAQALGGGIDHFMGAKKVLELNVKHPLVLELNRRVTLNPNDITAVDMAHILYDTAALHSGFGLENPAAFAKNIHKMMELGLSVAPEVEKVVIEEVGQHDEL